jgi:hypothetical protein
MKESKVLDHLGIIKNELLIFAVLIGTMIGGGGYSLTHAEPIWMKVCGVIMYFLMVLVPVAFGAFYVYAVLRLPGSARALIFASGAQQTLAEHNRQMSRQRRLRNEQQ